MHSEVTFPVIEVEGTPYECGKQYGQAAATLIKKNLEAYVRLYSFHTQLERDAAIKKAQRYLLPIEQFSPDILEEMHGIAEGAGVSLAEVVLLNTRMELLSQVPLHECTSIAVLPEAASQGQLWLAQNWDWLHVTKGLTILLKIRQVGKPLVVMLVEAGHVGKMGFNDAGLGLCVNWLEADKSLVGVPFIVLCRAVLNSDQVNNAIDILYGARRATSANFLIAHKSGFAVDLETTPDDIDFIEPARGLLVHTNHFVSERLRPLDNGLRRQGGDSLVRRQLAETMLKQHWGHIDHGVLAKVQSDRSCGTYSICTSPDEDAHELARWSTLAGIIMNLSSLEMYLAHGQPNEAKFRKLHDALA